MMGLYRESSRYYKQKTISVTDQKGQNVTALSLRLIPTTKGKERVVKQTDRLDVISQQEYKDSTKFWHIADANTELDATKLITKKIQTLEVPES